MIKLSPLAAAKISAARPVQHGLEIAIRERVGSISGCHVRSVRRLLADEMVPWVTLPTGHQVADPAGLLEHAAKDRYHVQASGWTGSLHLHDMEWTLMTPVADGAAGTLRALDRHLARQKARQRQGAKLETAFPWSIEGAQTHIGHMTIDRGLAVIMLENGIDERTIALDVATTMSEQDDYCGQDHVTSEGVTLDGLRYRCAIPLDGIGTYDGLDLKARTPIPQTAAIQAIGRMIGDVVEVPAILARHRIASVDVGDVTVFRLKPRPMRIAGMAALRITE